MNIVGDGLEKGYYQEMVRQLNLKDKIMFLGVLAKEQVAEILRNSDLFVLSSLQETFSVATLEALACGVPVLATASGGPAEFVTPEMGLLISPGSQEEIERGLLWMVSNINKFDPGAIARKIHRQFSYDVIGAQIHNIYASLSVE